MTTGTIFNIQRFCTDDGPGIRTTVFLKGCPLSCPWCHNPESQKSQLEITFDKNKCVQCGACVTACQNNCHTFEDKKHVFIREECIGCGKCVRLCPLNNITLEEGKPVWHDNCTHCMACICHCPVEAIEYGNVSRGKRRYRCLEYKK